MNKMRNTLPSSIITLIRSLVSYILAGCVIVLLFPLILLLLCLPDSLRYDNKILFWLLYLIHAGILSALFLPIRVEGRENILKEPAIFIANHESALDIPIAGSIMGPRPHIWYALDYYLKFPVLGFIIRRIGIPVPQGDVHKAARALVQGINLLKNQNRSLMIFPEGGRFTSIQSFFSGFVYLAEKIDRPIIPFYIHNAGKVYPPGSFLAHPFPLTIIIGEPFIKQTQETSEEFLKRIHSWFTKQQTKLSERAKS